MTKKGKGLSIGAAMKQRMQETDSPAVEDAPEKPVKETPETLESFNTRLPIGLHRRLKMHAAAEGRKIQDVVQTALIDYLEKKE
ncbi:hypothetical protein K7W42_17740 [Deinococcus sp. HMF7604]|uniref:hypothetical protein n=1 Tax=Deinococcus betulae TaxID=2873312 RepID=UPI001CC91C18|nr:hypothetical protein [Deinococcus betulae]MBZ9752688.1 hypothetical protein [Deinococcus betulae]